MNEPAALFYFDYVDPASYVIDVTMHRLGVLDRVRRIPFEVRTPESHPVDPEDAAWRDYQAGTAARAAELDIRLNEPDQIPWTRKAHELVAFAEERNRGEEVHRAVFDAHFVGGRDIGRIDVLVEIGVSAGLDFTETRAVLDVDRYAATIADRRAAAEEAEIPGVPTLEANSRRLTGLRSPLEIEQLFGAGMTGPTGRGS